MYLGVQCQVNLLTIWLLFLLLFISWTSLSKHWYLFSFSTIYHGDYLALWLSNLLPFCFHGPSNFWVRWGRLQHSPKELAHRVKAGEEKGRSEGGGGDRKGRGGGERRQGRRGFKQLQLKAPGGSCRPGWVKPLASFASNFVAKRL